MPHVESQIEKFWRKVSDKRRQIEADALAGKLDKVAVVTAGRVEAVWITSLDQNGPNDVLEYEDVSGDMIQDWRPGVACLAKPKLAAQRIVERSHRLAMPEEVAAELKRQKEQKELHDAQDRGLSQRQTVKVVQLPKEA